MAMNLIKRPGRGKERMWGRKIRESEEEQARRKGEGVIFSDVFFLAGNVGLGRQAMTTSMQVFFGGGDEARTDFASAPGLPFFPNVSRLTFPEKLFFRQNDARAWEGGCEGGEEGERQSGFRRLLLAQKKRLAGRREVIFCRLSPTDCLHYTPKWESNE